MTSSILTAISEPATAEATLEAFAYGEHFEGARSLGFRLLTPEPPQPWSREVDAVARRLQAASYPDDWPVTDAFCSILLDSGRRLIAIARYGLTDHTPSQRRGGLELIGLIAPASLSLSAVMSIAQWLRQRRLGLERLAGFSGRFDVVGVLAEAPTPPSLAGTALPRPLGRDRFLIIPATSGGDPDQQLGMLNYLPERNWQWLPFVPPAWSLAELAERGPLVAWATPEAMRSAPQLPPPEAPAERGRLWGWRTALILLLTGLLGANAWYLSRIEQRLAEGRPAATATPSNPFDYAKPVIPAVKKDDDKPADQEVLIQALYQHLRTHGCIPESRRDQLLKNYERLAAADENLRSGSLEGRLAIGAISDLARRKSPAQMEAMIRGLAAEKKGIDERVLDLIAERVYQRLTEGSE